MLPGLPSQVWPYWEVNPTVQDTVETSSDKMDNGSKVDQRSMYKPSTKLLNFIKKQIFIGIEKRMVGIEKNRRDQGWDR